MSTEIKIINTTFRLPLTLSSRPQVNEIPLDNVTHEEAVAALKATQEFVRLLVKKRPDLDLINPGLQQFVSG